MDNAQKYLFLLSRSNHLPNFWCSYEYFQKAGWVVRKNRTIGPLPDLNMECYWGVFDSGGQLMLPYISGFVEFKAGNCWAGFSTSTKRHLDYLLDHEFIYDPKHFLDLGGGQWRMVRKNLRWAEIDADEGFYVSFTRADMGEISELIESVAADGSEWYDPEVMVRYLFHGENRLYLRGFKTGKLYGIMVFDMNWNYINFRYCIVRPGYRGLSDTARVSFYQEIAKTYQGRLVNDGGSLGSEGLYRYKMRLNPIKINEIYTYQDRKDMANA
jgi:hypothetical protein